MISSSAAALLRSSCSFRGRFLNLISLLQRFFLVGVSCVNLLAQRLFFCSANVLHCPDGTDFPSGRQFHPPAPRRTDVSVSCARACSICRSSASICVAIRSYSSLMPSYRVVVSLKSPSAIRYFSSVSESCARVFSHFPAKIR